MLDSPTRPVGPGDHFANVPNGPSLQLNNRFREADMPHAPRVDGVRLHTENPTDLRSSGDELRLKHKEIVTGSFEAVLSTDRAFG